MSDIKKKIANTVNKCRDEIIEFIQQAVRLPSLANDEGPVQKLIRDKLNSLDLIVEKAIFESKIKWRFHAKKLDDILHLLRTLFARKYILRLKWGAPTFEEDIGC